MSDGQPPGDVIGGSPRVPMDEQDSQLIDIRIPTPLLMRRRVVALMVVCLLILIPGPMLLPLLFGGTKLIYVSFGLTLAVVFGFVAFVAFIPQYKARRFASVEAKRVRAKFKDASDPDIRTILSQLDFTRFDTRFSIWVLRKVVQELVKQGQTDFVLRFVFGDKIDLTPVEPISVPFEPVALRERDAGFQGLSVGAAGTDAGSPVDGDGKDAAASEPKRYRQSRRLHRWLLVMEIYFTACTILLLVGSVATTGGLDLRTLSPVLLLGPAALAARFIRSIPSQQTWVFPGGIAVPKRLGRPRWSIVRRSDGVLIWFSGISIHVVTANKLHHFMGRAAEADMALRAWLSPVPPPSDEQLAAFFD